MAIVVVQISSMEHPRGYNVYEADRDVFPVDLGDLLVGELAELLVLE